MNARIANEGYSHMAKKSIKDDGMMEIQNDFPCGVHIETIIKLVIERMRAAIAMDDKIKGVYFDFNGNRVNVFAHDDVKDVYRRFEREREERWDAYRKSPEGIADAAKLQAMQDKTKARFTLRYSKKPKWSNYAAVVRWIASWLDDVTPYTFSRNQATETWLELDKHGYVVDAHCLPDDIDNDAQKEYSNALVKDRRRFGEYLIGQAMASMKMGYAPHDIYLFRYENWKKLPATKKE